MSTGKKEDFHNLIKLQNMRMTRPRKGMINILEDKHLTFKELVLAMRKKGFLNLQTVYNTLEFLLSQNVVNEVKIFNQIYYELSLTNQHHNANFNIHIIKERGDGPIIKEIFAPEIFVFINQFDELKKEKITGIKIVIEAE